MRFDIRTHAYPGEPRHPLDLGEVVIHDVETGRESGPLPPHRHYMAFIEITVLHDLILMALRGEGPDRYTVSSGEELVLDSAAGMATFRFEGLTATMALLSALLALRAAIERGLAMLADYEDQDHSAIQSLRIAVDDGRAQIGEGGP